MKTFWPDLRDEKTMVLVVTCAPGLESLLQEELQELGVKKFIEPDKARGLAFLRIEIESSGEMLSEIIVNSRLASRVLLPLKAFPARDPAMLYDQVRRMPWAELFSAPENTLAIFVHGTSTELLKTNFVALKIKDAICDEVRKSGLERPNVDRSMATVRLEVQMNSGRCEISLDLSGPDVLHRRGWRAESGSAPLRENRAAALARLCEAEKYSIIADPFCGSGTLLVEAAWRRLGISASALKRIEDFSLPQFHTAWATVLAKKLIEAQKNAKDIVKNSKDTLKILASDIDSKALRDLKANCERAGILPRLSVEKMQAMDLQVPEGTLVLSNPPWGERLSEQKKAAETLSQFADHLKRTAKGCRWGLVLGESLPLDQKEKASSLPAVQLTKSVGLRPSKKIKTGTGNLWTHLWRVELY